MESKYSTISLTFLSTTIFILAVWVLVAYLIVDVQNFQDESMKSLQEFKIFVDETWKIMHADENRDEMMKVKRAIRVRKNPFFTAPLGIPPSPTFTITRIGEATHPAIRPPLTARARAMKIIQTDHGISRMIILSQNDCTCCENELSGFGQNQKCPAGNRGDVGSRGLDGEDGEPGEDGVPGFSPEYNNNMENNSEELIEYDYESNMLVKKSNCFPCPEGRAGLPGPDGEIGDKGARGEDGLPGLDGLISDGAERGPEGDRGMDGLMGVMGPPGPPGEPMMRFVGLPGPKGKIGIQGEPGQPGFPGKNYVGFEIPPFGREGPAGKPGMRGLDGEIGFPGLPGKPGLPGSDGSYCRCPAQSPKKISSNLFATDISKKYHKAITDDYDRQWKLYLERIRKRRRDKLHIIFAK